MKQLVIIGAGGHGKVVAEAALLQNKWDKIVFVDERYPELDRSCEWDVIGSTIPDAEPTNSKFVIAIGDNETRAKVTQQVVELGYELATVIHPSAVVSRFATIGPGSVALAGVVVNNGAEVKTGVILNTSSTVDHDCVIGNYCHLSPGAHLSGHVVVGDYSWFGTGVVTKHSINVCSGVIVGVGGVIVSDLVEPGIYIGNPANLIKDCDESK